MEPGRLGSRELAQFPLRLLPTAGLLAALLWPSTASAGQIYGAVVSGGQGLPNTAIEIACNGAVTVGSTAADGSYRIDVPNEGQCTLALPGFAGRPSAVIFSNPNPSGYNFELVRNPDGNHVLRTI